ncbi:MAG: HRDC domain-containing protein [Gammaproteobacteria bacterium]|nr:HRDC domain-containing protein [Gammaproteobacteria bacterium]MDH4253252.1 HRDC domain-containing protein [Gammaproteobacteria bacterium]MDH5308969.1 HRDC domain-containing protein [Gammaproteobacteria bacterium]
MLRTRLVNPAADDELVEMLASGGRIGLDTEFMRESTFYAQLCLVQIATPQSIYCADPLIEGELGPFWKALCQCEWVLHSGRQDLEVVYQTAGRMPRHVFDTQVAAGLLGMQPQLGYAQLVKELFDVELAKGHTRADWSQRPLGEAMLDYASEDVAYLLEAATILIDRLEALGRLDWALEDSAALLDPALYEFHPADAIERLKAARNLRGRARRAAVRLAAWREKRAQQADRPRQWILKDSVLMELAGSDPSTEADIGRIPGMPAATARRSGRELLAELQAARDEKDEYVPPGRPDERQKAALKRMQTEVVAISSELGIAAEVLAPRKELSAAIQGDRTGRVFRGWRRELIGDRLLELI